MSLVSAYFNSFNDDISHLPKPKKFTYPFCYEPDQFALKAAHQLQHYLTRELGWNKQSAGKMFGVLVVEDLAGEIGFLTAYSGNITDNRKLGRFVPFVLPVEESQAVYSQESKIINNINQEIDALSLSSVYQQLLADAQQAKACFTEQVSAKQAEMVLLKAQRKQQREQAKAHLVEKEYQLLEKKLNSESIVLKKQLLELKATLQSNIELTVHALSTYENKLTALKKLRKKRSNKLQKALFSQYHFLNAQHESKNLVDIFSSSGDLPPSGAGDCAAPKLLQYAYSQQLTPISMAEFWWGESPKSQIRQHGKFYPSCQSKCAPILGHMLEGLQVDDNPLLINTGADKVIEILYQDNDIAVINKPEDLLSVPGKLVQDSVLTRMRLAFPQASGPIIVHRLDMSTSGLMVLALSSRANKVLQQQFIERTVKKEYIALIEGKLKQRCGEISLPLRQDLEDRPRQMVCFEHGKPSLTYWQLIRHEGEYSRVLLEPKTGRTHQLRMHCVHQDGLNMAIVGDDLYGKKNNRLHLHAKTLSFIHPVSKKQMRFEVKEGF